MFFKKIGFIGVDKVSHFGSQRRAVRRFLVWCAIAVAGEVGWRCFKRVFVAANTNSSLFSRQ